MARIYAGILGPLAFLTTLAHGAVHGHRPEAILFSAWANLVAFAAAGCAAGWTAGRIVEDSVRGRIEAEAAKSRGNQPGT